MSVSLNITIPQSTVTVFEHGHVYMHRTTKNVYLYLYAGLGHAYLVYLGGDLPMHKKGESWDLRDVADYVHVGPLEININK